MEKGHINFLPLFTEHIDNSDVVDNMKPNYDKYSGHIKYSFYCDDVEIYAIVMSEPKYHILYKSEYYKVSPNTPGYIIEDIYAAINALKSFDNKILN